jgi:hypothetical protein
MKYDDEKKTIEPRPALLACRPDETQAKRIPFRAKAWKKFCYLM